jgi:hypothetical protein
MYGEHGQLQARDRQVKGRGGEWSEQPRDPAMDGADRVPGPNDHSESHPIEQTRKHASLPALSAARGRLR